MNDNKKRIRLIVYSGIIPPVVFNGLIVGGYLPFILLLEKNSRLKSLVEKL